MKKYIRSLLLSASFLSVSSIANAGYEVEPNNDKTNANVIAVNEPMQGTLPNYKLSSDYFRFNLTEARTDVTFKFKQISENSSYAIVYLYNSSGSTVTYKKINAFDTNELSFIQSLTAGIYYVRIYSSSTPKADVDYELSVITKVSVPPAIIGSVGMPDLNEDGQKDTAILRIKSDASAVVETRDSATGDVINTAEVLNGEQPALKPVSIADLGENLVSVIVNNSLEKTNTQYIVDVVSGETVNTFPLD